TAPVVYSPDETRLAARANDKTVEVFDVASGKQQLTLDPNTFARLFAIAFSPDGKKIATGGDWFANQLCIWDSSTGNLLATAKKVSARALRFTDDSKTLLVEASGQFEMYDASDLTLRGKCFVYAMFAAFLSDWHRVIADGDGSRICLYKPDFLND